jgi:hypothetical protein
MKTNTMKQSDKKSTNVTAAKPPKVSTVSDLSVTDPRRKLTKEELKALSKEERKARQANRAQLRGAPKARLFKQITSIEKRVARLVGKFKDATVAAETGETISDYLRKATNLVGAASELISELPDGWTPTRGRPKQARIENLEVGMTVALATNVREDFAAVVETSDMDSLKVVKIQGKRVLVKTPSGMPLFLEQRLLRGAE